MDTGESLTVRNELAELERLHVFLSRFSEKHCVPAELALELELALEEVFCNVVKHGYQDDHSHEITIELRAGEGLVTISVEDDAVAFNPLQAPAPVLDAPLEERPIGGLGVHMIRTIMDEVEYRREGGRNRLVMKKHVEGGL